MNRGHLLFITAANLATNPRCLKEIRLALHLQYKVTVIKFEFHNWSEALENDIENKLPGVQFYKISAGKTPFMPWLISTFIEQISNVLFKFSPSGMLASFAVSKRTWLIFNRIRKYSFKPDMVIAHNPAAFWPAYYLSDKMQIPCGIDVEDYHPGEFKDEKKIRVMNVLMSKVLMRARYVSFASSSIQKLSVKHFAGIKKSFVIDNCFEQSEFIKPSIKEDSPGKLRFLWFSQNINFTRGLEIVIPLFKQFAGEIEITLIGNLNREFEIFLVPYSSFITIVKPLPQADLHSFLQNADIGLAIEAGKDVNNNIALSNKIWSYFQAGLFILATSTESQTIFLKQHPSHGKLFDIHNEDSLVNTINYLIENKGQIRQFKTDRYKQAMAYSWEHESKKLAKEWQEILLQN